MVAVRRAIELNQLTVTYAEAMTNYETDPLLNVRYCAGHQTFHVKDCFTRSQVVSAPAARVCSKWFASGRPFPVGICQISTPAKMASAYNQNLEDNGLEPLTSHADLADLSTPLPRDAVQDLIARIYSDEMEPTDDNPPPDGSGTGSNGAGPATTPSGLRTGGLGFVPHRGTRSEKQVLSRNVCARGSVCATNTGFQF